MKNIAKIFYGGLVAVMCSVLLASCSSGQPEGPSSSGNTATTAATTTDSAPVPTTSSKEDNITPGGKFASMEDYVNSDIVQSQIADSIEGMGMEIQADGNKLIYIYTYETQMPTDSLASILESALESQKSTFQSVASTLKSIVDVENPVVVVSYRNADGSEIVSQEFAAE